MFISPVILCSSARHASFHETAAADGVLGYLVAFLVLLAMVKLWHLLRLNPKLQMITATLRRAWNDISGFIIVMTIMFLAYSIAVKILELNLIFFFLSNNKLKLCSHYKLHCLLLCFFVFAQPLSWWFTFVTASDPYLNLMRTHLSQYALYRFCDTCFTTNKKLSYL